MTIYSTDGNRILKDGQPFVIRACNWFGMESAKYAPHGLWIEGKSVLGYMALMKSLGFNAVRLPWSNDLLKERSQYDWCSDSGMTTLKGMDRLKYVVEQAHRAGLGVVLDRHQYEPGGSNGEKWKRPDQAIGEAKWISDWVAVATALKGSEAIIGYDLHNEAHEIGWNDLAAMYERCGNAILSVDSSVLIICEGSSEEGWWGGNLQGVKNRPVVLSVPNKLVYSPHEYGPGVFMQQWFNDPLFPANMTDIYRKFWFYIHEQGIAPILIGEFGGLQIKPAQGVEGKWQANFVSFIGDHGLSFAYWCLNPNSSDTGGIIIDEQNWSVIDGDKVQMLSPILEKNITQLPENTPDPGGLEAQFDKILEDLADIEHRLEAEVSKMEFLLTGGTHPDPEEPSGSENNKLEQIRALVALNGDEHKQIVRIREILG